MIARKLTGLLVSTAFLLYFLTGFLNQPLSATLPPEAAIIGWGLFAAVGLYLAFKLSRYVSATADERDAIHQDFVRWFLPMRGYDTREMAMGNVELVARESRAVMLLKALEALPIVVVFLIVNAQDDMPSAFRSIFLVVIGLTLLRGLITLAQSVIADDLVVVSAAGLALPLRYGVTIPWDKIKAVELRRKHKKGYYLFVHFSDPEGPDAWRGVLGKIRGYFARRNGNGIIEMPLWHMATEPFDIRAAIDHHLAKRRMEVVTR